MLSGHGDKQGREIQPGISMGITYPYTRWIRTHRYTFQIHVNKLSTEIVENEQDHQ